MADFLYDVGKLMRKCNVKRIICVCALLAAMFFISGCGSDTKAAGGSAAGGSMWLQKECVKKISAWMEERALREREEAEAERKAAAEAEAELRAAAEAIGLKEDRVEVDLPGVSGEYEILFISDMHIIALDDSVVPESYGIAEERYHKMFRTETDMSSADNWTILSSALDAYRADGIIFGGDMIDFVSQSNVDILKKGFLNIDTPYMYLRADHDFGTWYSGFMMDHGDALALHEQISEYKDVYIMEYEEFYILGWNNSTSDMTGEGLRRAEEIWDDGKPIILATHVPLDSMVATGLKEESARMDPHGRSKIWGWECQYHPNETTSTFLKMVYDSQSPVKAVLSGHLHFKYTVPLTNQITGYVFAPAFSGNIARIRIY